ncbi:MAG: hypothetical protein R2867_38765 [Caldilineaceae bacterium]
MHYIRSRLVFTLLCIGAMLFVSACQPQQGDVPATGHLLLRHGGMGP